MQVKQRIVIIGAGFGGLSAALEFAEMMKKSKKDRFDVTVIDKNEYQLYTPDLYEIASGNATVEESVELKNTVCIDVKLALRALRVQFFAATVESVDRAAKKVHTTNGIVSYDYLIVAPGSVSFDYHIPGIADYTTKLKTVDDALSIREQLMERERAGQRTHVVICGGGPAGCELAAELAIAHAVQKRGSLVSVSLIDAAPRLLTMWAEKASRLAVKRLQGLGVDVTLNWMVSQVAFGVLTNKQNETLQADLIIWTGGVTANPLVQQCGLQLTQKQQIPVESTLQSPEDSAIFAIGDSAQIPVAVAARAAVDTDTAAPMFEYAPQTAYEAVEQGELAAWNVFQAASGGHLRSYRSTFLAAVVTLGGKYGILILPKNIVLRGRIGYWARKIVDLKHFQKVLPFMRACSFWYTGMRTMNKNNNPQ